MFDTLHILLDKSSLKNPRKINYFCFHVTDKETKAQGDKGN